MYLYLIQDKKVFNKKWAKPYIPKIAKKIYFKTSDGISLEGAFTKNGDNLPLILYFSGNANNAIEFLDKIATKIKNYNFIGFNYPGYAGSKGKPCEKCIEKYALEIFDKYKPNILIGRSLGSAVASYVASKRKVKKILLITPFSSIGCIAKIKYPFFPVSLILKYKFNEAKFISKTDTPVCIIALKDDDKVPQKCLNILIKKIKNLKNIYYLNKIKHGNIYNYPHIENIIYKALSR
jgi:pimeloyl-ACP methyl ester carboxylesterase